MSQELIQSSFSHYLIIGGAVVGLVWGGINAHFVSAPLPSVPCLAQACWLANPSRLT